MPSIPAPGCCIGTSVDGASTAVVGTGRSVSVLLVEDSRTDAVLVAGTLHHSPAASFTVAVEDTLAGALAHLEREAADVAALEVLATRLLETADETMYRIKRRGGRSITVVELAGAER